MSDLKVVVRTELMRAKKENDGSISRKTAIKVMQNIFKRNNGTIKEASTTHVVNPKDTENEPCFIDIKRETTTKNEQGTARSNGYGYGYGGFLSQTKDLFELYMDADSEGGTAITSGEQGEIINTINAWF